jgi:hypothetical protein
VQVHCSFFFLFTIAIATNDRSEILFAEPNIRHAAIGSASPASRQYHLFAARGRDLTEAFAPMFRSSPNPNKSEVLTFTVVLLIFCACLAQSTLGPGGPF